jgi:hypothetical protein
LANSELGRQWLAQFEPADVETAKRLLSALTLVSHNAFERAITAQIVAEAEKVDGSVALYATRECDDELDLFKFAKGGEGAKALDAVDRGADLGSEARVAAIIRNLAKVNSDKLLNHPTLEVMREKRCRSIFVIDDYIGSGKRTADFLSAIWRSSAIKSWHSLKWIDFVSIAYSATARGGARVCRQRMHPRLVLERDCPTYPEMPWRAEIKDEVQSLCWRYGARTSRRSMRLGFDKVMAALVFEHGCPNNAPAILWAPTPVNKKWMPLFPDRSVVPDHASAFPPDILARDTAGLLVDLKPAGSVDEVKLRASPLGDGGIALLALLGQGVRTRSALAFTTGYTALECTRLLDQCTQRGYISANLRLTAAGRAELAEALKGDPAVSRVPERGDDCYYPRQLGGPHGG